MLTPRQQIIARIFQLMDVIHDENSSDAQIESAMDLIGVNLKFFVTLCGGKLAPAYNKLSHAGLGEIFDIYYLAY